MFCVCVTTLMINLKTHISYSHLHLFIALLFFPSTPLQSPGHSFGEKEFWEINQFSFTMKFDTTQT